MSDDISKRGGQVSPTLGKPAVLKSILARLERVAPDVARSLRPGVRPSDLSRLADLVTSGSPLPAALEAWFTWHDGQAPDVFAGVDPDRPAQTWLTMSSAIAAWTFLSDPGEDVQQPWSRDWLPIIENGGGDYVVYVLRGDDAGSLKDYFHDSSKRPRVAASLAAYLAGVNQRLGKIDKAAVAQAALPTRIARSEDAWQDSPAPTLEDLSSCPVGTAFHRRSLPYRSYWYCLFVKIADHTWLEASAQNPPPCSDDDMRIEAALEEAARVLRKPLLEWKEEDARVVESLSDEKIWPNNLNALGGQSSRGNPYFIRRRGALVLS